MKVSTMPPRELEIGAGIGSGEDCLVIELRECGLLTRVSLTRVGS